MIQAISEAPFPSFVAAASLALLITSCSDKTDVEEPSPTTVDASTTVVTSALSELLERSSFALSRPVVQHHLYPRRRPQPTQRSTTEDGLAIGCPITNIAPLAKSPIVSLTLHQTKLTALSLLSEPSSRDCTSAKP